MSTPSTPTFDGNAPASPSQQLISHEALAAAAERRSREQPTGPTHAQLAEEHEKRQAFRRLINPGIFERNSKEVYMAALKTLSTLAENLLREPDNAHYQRFKPTNSIIKQRLIDPKGALEYAIAMGFRTEVDNFQPYYVFNTRRMNDLRIGAAILKEAIELESQKAERAALSKKEEKAAVEAAALKVKLAFMDDRRSKSMFDARERQLREARAAAAAATTTREQAANQESALDIRSVSLTPLNPDSEDPPPYDNH